jgi:methionyl aminopeptidase
VNDVALHGIPTADVLDDGDLLSVDAGATLDGWVGDAAITFSVGTPRPEDVRLVATAEAALQAGIAAAQPGGKLGDIAHAVGVAGRAQGHGMLADHGGHGIGRSMHEDPHLPNEGRAGRGMRLKPGLALAIEPMLTRGGDDYRYAQDGWSILTADGSRAAHVEHTIAITEDGPRVLTVR